MAHATPAAPVAPIESAVTSSPSTSPAGVAGAPLAASLPVAIGAAFGGGIYAGLTIVDGALARLVLLPDAASDITWDDAVTWAGTVGAELPTRQELITLYQNLKSEFEPRWYWSGQQHEADAGYAWSQLFSYGYQHNFRKSYAVRARAVRRLPI